MAKRVLVVDDLPDLRATVCGILEDNGWIARSASNSVEAFDLWE